MRINILQRFSKEQSFKPGLIALFTNPFYFARLGLYKYISKFVRELDGHVLDVGCGTKPYENLFSGESYTGLEIESDYSRTHSKADFFYDGLIIPFDSESFDGVLCNQVFEHVFNPIDFIKEINRILKIGGSLVISVPFVWDEHEQPYDYARYSSFGLKYILQENGFELIEFKKSNNGLEVVFQLINAYLYKILNTRNSYLNLILCVIFMAPFNIIGSIISKILPRNNDLYLDSIVLAKKLDSA